MKRIGLGIAALALLCGSAFVPASATVGAEPSVDMLAQRQRSTVRRYYPSSPSRSTRTYRSYSVEPGTTADSAAVGEAPAVMAPAPQPRSYGPSRPSGGSRPSYMRSDSKAKGRYGQ